MSYSKRKHTRTKYKKGKSSRKNKQYKFGRKTRNTKKRKRSLSKKSRKKTKRRPKVSNKNTKSGKLSKKLKRKLPNITGGQEKSQTNQNELLNLQIKERRQNITAKETDKRMDQAVGAEAIAETKRARLEAIKTEQELIREREKLRQDREQQRSKVQKRKSTKQESKKAEEERQGFLEDAKYYDAERVSEEQKLLFEKNVKKALSSKKKIKSFIKNSVNDKLYKKQLHPLIGKYLLQGGKFRNQIKKASWEEKGRGISTITANYAKYANEKLFVVILPEITNLKKMFYKKNLKKLQVLYLGDTLSKVKDAVSTPEPGIYIFIVMKESKLPGFGGKKLVGVMRRESRDKEEVFRRALTRESFIKQNQQPMMAQPMMQQPMMAQPMMAQPMMQQPMMQQPMMPSNSVADREKAILDTNLEIQRV